MYGPTSELQRFAVDFGQHCEGMRPALFGSLRFNSAVPVGPRPPSAYASAPARVDEGASVVVDASASVDPQDGALAFAWTQTAGPAVTLYGADSATATIVTPSVDPGGLDLEFRVTVTNALGLSNTAIVRVHVRDASDPRSVFRADVRPGYPSSASRVYTLTDAESTMSVLPPTAPTASIIVQVRHGFDVWSASFSAPIGATLARGTYANVGAVASSTNGAMQVFGSGVWYCPTIGGSFDVLEIDTAGPLTKLAIDFVQYCNGYPGPMYGSVRINSAIPVTEVPFTQFSASTWSGGNATATLSGGGTSCRFDNPHWIAPPPGFGESPPTLPAPGVAFPYGLFAFGLANCAPGAAVSMTLTLPQSLPAGTVYWKYGPTPDNHVAHWYQVPATIAGNTVTFTVVDGGLGDDDLTANGSLIDAGGPGSGGPVAIVQPVQVPVLPGPLLAALSAMLMLIALP